MRLMQRLLTGLAAVAFAGSVAAQEINFGALENHLEGK